MRNSCRAVAKPILLSLAVALCVPALAGVALAADEEIRLLTTEVPEVPGPKRTIAVGQIDSSAATTSFAADNIGPSVANMLGTGLRESMRVTLVERAALAQMLTEQELATSGVSGGSNAPTPGRVLPAQYLIVGAVTEFSTGDSGGGVGIGGLTGGLGLGLSLSRNEGSVAFDLRVVDTRTSEVTHSFSVRRELTARSVGFTGNYSGVALNGNEFWSTPLGEATRLAVNDAVVEILVTLANQPWQGLVVEADNGFIYINAGADSGIQVGDQLSVERVGRVLTDPATGQVLSSETHVLGVVTVTEIQPRLSIGVYSATQEIAPQRGDLLIFQ